MKMIFPTLLLLPLVFIWSCTSQAQEQENTPAILAADASLTKAGTKTDVSSPYATGDALYVFAHSGLTLRDKPSKEGTKIITVPNKEKVEVVDTNPFQIKYSAKESCGLEIKGHWVKVNYNGKEGYLFDGYLLRYKPVDEQSMEEYWTAFSKVKSSTDQPPQDEETNYYSYLHTTWENGVEFLNEGYEGGNSSTLTLPKELFTYQEAYLFGMTEVMGYKENPYTCTYNPETQVTECSSADDMALVFLGWDANGNLEIKDSYAD